MHNHDHSKLDSFGKDRAHAYDLGNRYLDPIIDNLHYLIKVLLSDLNPQSKILCVGAGTGAEVVALAAAFPEFTFVAVDPSESMLEVCRGRLEDLSLVNRCKLIHGYVHDVPETESFDAALCLLVLHHTSESERQEIVAGIAKRIRPEGCFISSELSHDLSADTAGAAMENWKSLSRKAGTPEEKIQQLPKLMKQHLSIMSPSEIESLLKKNGFEKPAQFFQSFLIRAWYARKER